jgi:hypothetical protein
MRRLPKAIAYLKVALRATYIYLLGKLIEYYGVSISDDNI